MRNLKQFIKSRFPSAVVFMKRGLSLINSAMNFIKFSFSLITLSVPFMLFSIRQSLKTLPQGRKSIVFVLDNERLYRNERGRYAYLIMNWFSESGYNVYFYKKVGLPGFLRLNIYGRFIYSIKNLKFITRLPDNSEEIDLAFDLPREDILRRKWKRLTYVNIVKPTFCKVGEMINIPYFLHPRIYKLDIISSLGEFRAKQRKMRIFFGGNTIKSGYDWQSFKKKYNQLNRYEAINAVLGAGDKRIKAVENTKRFYKLLNGDKYINECYIFQTDRVPPIAARDWLNIVSKSDFFLCFSGTDMPMCHNAIESLAVGTIPIISYPDWFFPPLEHRKNAILYSGKEDLFSKVKEVFEMSMYEIEAMRKNAIEYYENNLSRASFMNRFETSSAKVNTIMLHPRLICSDRENDEGARILNAMESYPELR